MLRMKTTLRPVALALPLALVALAPACGLLESDSRDDRRAADDARAKPESARTVRMAMRLGASAQPLPGHDAYDVEVSYLDSAETAPYLGRKRASLTAGTEITVGAVRTLPEVRVRVNLFSREALVARCETDVLDLSRVTDKAVNARLVCVAIEAGAPTGRNVTVPVVAITRPTTDLVLEPEFKDAVGDLIARAQDGLLFLNSAISYDGRPAQAELAFLAGATQSAERGALALKVTEQASGATLVSLEDGAALVDSLRGVLLGSLKLRLSGKLLASVTAGEAITREYVDATFELSSARPAAIFTNEATRALKATIRLTAVELDGRPVDAASGAPSFEVEFALRDSASPAPGRITVGNYNVENAWDDSEASGVHYEDYASATSNWYADKMWLKKSRQVAAAVALAGAPDVLLLQEIESGLNTSRSLELLKPELAKLGYRYFALGLQADDNPVAVTTAVVSKFPIVENGRLDFVYSEAGADARMADELKLSSRDPQYAVIDVQGRPVRVYTSHFKSKRSGDEAGDRMREATASLIKSDIDSATKANPLLDVIVAGDLNTDYTDPTLVRGLSSTGDESAMLGAAGAGKLYNLWYELPVEKRGSYPHDGKRTAIDNMLVNDALFDDAGLRIVDGSFRVVGTTGLAREFLVNADGTPLRWQATKARVPGQSALYTKHLGVGFSDHLPLVATFEVLAAKPVNVTKDTRESPSTTDVGPGPAAYVDDEVPVCAAGEPVIDPTKVNPLLPQYLGKCVSLEGVKLPLRRDGERDAGVDVGGVRLLIGVTRAFGANKGWLGSSLSPLAGAADVTRLKGRIGYSMGRMAVLVHDTKADIALAPYVTCASAADVVGKLEDVRAEADLEKNRMSCLSFGGATAEIGAIAAGVSGTQNVGTIRVAGGAPLILRMPVDAARALFPATGSYAVEGFGVLDYFAPRKEWQVNLAAFGGRTGTIAIVPATPAGGPAGIGIGAPAN